MKKKKQRKEIDMIFYLFLSSALNFYYYFLITFNHYLSSTAYYYYYIEDLYSINILCFYKSDTKTRSPFEIPTKTMKYIFEPLVFQLKTKHPYTLWVRLLKIELTPIYYSNLHQINLVKHNIQYIEIGVHKLFYLNEFRTKI